MKSFLTLLICLVFLGNRLGISGHTAHPATSAGDSGISIDTINHIDPDRTLNFTIESANSTVTITSLPNGIDLSVEPSIETINSISPDGSGNFTINAGSGVMITPGINSFTIAAPGGGSGISAITADEGGFVTGSVTLSGGSTGLTTDAISGTEIELTGTLDVANGGTGATTLTGVLVGNGTSTVTGNAVTQHDVLVGGASNAITSVTPSTAGFVLTSNGTGANPSFQTVSASGAVTTITGNSGGAESPSSGNFNIVGTGSITVAGTTNTETVELTGLTDHNVLVGAGTATMTNVAPSSTSGVPLISQGSSSDPAFGTAVAGGGTGATTLTGVLIGNGTSAVTGNTVTQHDVLVGGASNAITSVTPSTAGFVLTSNGTGANPSFQAFAEGVSEFVVDSRGNARYTTIQSAITAAAAVATSTIPQTVWIWPGTYTENLSIPDYISLAGAISANGATGSDTLNPFVPVNIVGFATYTSTDEDGTGFFSAANIQFTAASGDCMTITGNANTTTFTQCTFLGESVASCITNEASFSVMYLYSCNLSAFFGNVAFNTNTVFTSAFDCISYSGGTGSVIENGSASFYNCVILDAFDLQDGSSISTIGCTLTAQSDDVAMFSLGTDSSDCSLFCFNCTINNGNTNWVTGTGTVQYANVVATLAGNAPTIDTSDITITAQTTQFDQVSFDYGTTFLNPVTQGTSHQVLLGTGTSALAAVSGTGTSGQVLTSNGTGANPSFQTVQAFAEGVSEFVVDSQGNAGYTTIQSAIDAAALVADSTTPQTVWVWPGTYTESLTLQPWVNLAAAVDSSADSSVIVVGNAVYPDPSTGNFSINNISFQNAAFAAALSLQSTQTSVVVLNSVDCNAQYANTFPWTGFECVGSGMTVYYKNGSIETLTGGNSINVTAGTVEFISTIIQFNNSDFQSTIGGGTTTFVGCSIQDSLAIGGGTVMIYNTFIDATGSLSFPAISVGGGANVYISDCILNTSSTSHVIVATGEGNLYYGNITSLADVGIDSGITLNNLLEMSAPISFDGGVSTFSTSGGNSIVLTDTGITNVTLPTSGTLATTSQLYGYPVTTVTGPTTYTVASTDVFLRCDTAGAITIQLPIAPATGRTFIIKDATGNAGTDHITVTVSSGDSTTIDNVSTYTMSTDYQSINVLFDGFNNYEIFSAYP